MCGSSLESHFVKNFLNFLEHLKKFDEKKSNFTGAEDGEVITRQVIAVKIWLLWRNKKVDLSG